MKTVQMLSPAGMNITAPNAIIIVEEEHNIECPNCVFGLVRGFLGFSRVCPICKGTNSIGSFKTKKVLI